MFRISSLRSAAFGLTTISLSLSLAFSAPQTNAAVISFQDAPLGPIASYAEAGFAVTTSSGSWFASAYGAPGPSLQFQQTSEGSIQITGGTPTFTFESIALYSSITPIPYVITGYRASTPVFSMTGTVPNTFGNFATVLSTSTQLIDALSVSLSNPACCFNPVGLDNIALTPVPEPSRVVLYLVGTLALALRIKRDA